jgi:drug/metabolite transporter (DMT)-like permease
MNKETKGIVLALLAAVVSGIAIPVNKLFIVTLDPTVFTAVRAVIIGIAFLAISTFQSKSSKRKFKSVPWTYLLSIAVIGGALAFLLYFNGLELTTAGRAAFLQKTLPLYVAVLAFLFLREKMTKKMACALVAMMVGTLMIYFTQIAPATLWSNPSLGDMLVIAATVLWAIEAVIAKKAMLIGETNFVVSFARMFFGGLILFGFVVVFGKLGVLMALSAQQWVNIFISTAILFAYVLFWYWSMKFINVTKATTLLLLAPVISTVGGVLMFNEPLPLLQIAGSAVILIGAYLVSGVRSEFREKL